ncbi:MAG: hypothetical protein QW786_01315, partial [Candidatus Hadarchaeum sp.]
MVENSFSTPTPKLVYTGRGKWGSGGGSMKSLADELFADFREHSVSEFFRRNAAMLGYTGKIRSLTTIVHEGVTNAIDAAEEAGILPKVTVMIKRVNDEPEHFRIVIEDNASGIPEQ